MFNAYLVGYEPGGPMPSARKEVSVQEFDVLESPQQEVFPFFPDLCEQANELLATCPSKAEISSNTADFELLRSRSRIRRRRRKRAWGILRIYLLPVVPVHGTLQGHSRSCS
jgi:hypothetical protein